MKKINRKIKSLNIPDKATPAKKPRQNSMSKSPEKKHSKKSICKTPTKAYELDSTHLNIDSLQHITTFSEKNSLEKKIITLKKKLSKANNVIKTYEAELLKAFETIAELKGRLDSETSTKASYLFSPPECRRTYNYN